MPSIRYKLVETMFGAIGVNKMLDKQGADFEKLLKEYSEKQKKPLKIPYKKLEKQFDVLKKDIAGTNCYVIRLKSQAPKTAVLYLFGGGYILPPDPGDLIICGQIAANCGFWVIPGTEEIPFVQTWPQVFKKRGILTLIWIAGAALIAGIVALL